MKTQKVMAILAVTLFTLSLIVPAATVNAAIPDVVGYWKMDQITASDNNRIAPDETGVNNAILGPADHEPVLVDSPFDKGIQFDGAGFAYVAINFLVGFPPSSPAIQIPISTNLNIEKQIKLEAWINVQALKTDAEYNQVIVKCTRTTESWDSIDKVVGLAVKSAQVGTDASATEGYLSGFVLTDTGGYNEIVTTSRVIPLNTWVHVAFERTGTGMHLYLNGAEMNVNVVHGVQAPVGDIVDGTEVYFGHDAKITMDEVEMIDLAPIANAAASSIEIGDNMLIAIIAVSVIFAVAWLLRRAVQMWIIRAKA
ncbi:MAG: LamG domain-containing protein [Candidatus Bathyarchaeota archaeon]|nr:LamG domain-containing protein [Candidatus Bathyarchaeota archaeon]